MACWLLICYYLLCGFLDNTIWQPKNARFKSVSWYEDIRRTTDTDFFRSLFASKGKSEAKVAPDTSNEQIYYHTTSMANALSIISFATTAAFAPDLNTKEPKGMLYQPVRSVFAGPIKVNDVVIVE